MYCSLRVGGTSETLISSLRMAHGSLLCRTFNNRTPNNEHRHSARDLPFFNATDAAPMYTDTVSKDVLALHLLQHLKETGRNNISSFVLQSAASRVNRVSDYSLSRNIPAVVRCHICTRWPPLKLSAVGHPFTCLF